jgi:hypothetical protein
MLDGTHKSDDCLDEFLKKVLQPQETQAEQVSLSASCMNHLQCFLFAARVYNAKRKLTFLSIRFITTFKYYSFQVKREYATPSAITSSAFIDMPRSMSMRVICQTSKILREAQARMRLSAQRAQPWPEKATALRRMSTPTRRTTTMNLLLRTKLRQKKQHWRRRRRRREGGPACPRYPPNHR